MDKRKIEDVVTDIVLPIVEKNSFELVGVEYVKEGGNWYLRIYIDKPGGINLDDCQNVSEELSDRLDEIDPIKQSYFLEVSSPGLERPLKNERDFEKFKGEVVEVKLFQPVNGKKIFEGQLVGLIENKVVIKPDDTDILEFDREKVALVKRVIRF